MHARKCKCCWCGASRKARAACCTPGGSPCRHHVHLVQASTRAAAAAQRRLREHAAQTAAHASLPIRTLHRQRSGRHLRPVLTGWRSCPPSPPHTPRGATSCRVSAPTKIVLPPPHLPLPATHTRANAPPTQRLHFCVLGLEGLVLGGQLQLLQQVQCVYSMYSNIVVPHA